MSFIIKKQKEKLGLPMIGIRDLTEEDIAFLLNYWFHSPAGFIESMGVDLLKLPSEHEMENSLRQKVQLDSELPASKLNAVIITYDSCAVGFHTLSPYTEGDSGVFHAHIWQPALRGHGIGLQSYPLACRVFIQRFNLQRILFKTPKQNVGAIRVKEKLGIRLVGEEIITFGIIKDGTSAKVFELNASELEKL